MKAKEVAHKKAGIKQKPAPKTSVKIKPEPAPVMEKPVLEQKPVHKEDTSHEHTVFGVHDHHQAHVNRLKHTDPDLWNRIRSWN